MEKTWFEFPELRKRRLADAVWIPLRVSHTISDEGQYGCLGYKDEFYGLGSVAIPTSRRKEAGKLGWSDLGGHEQGVWATSGYYKPADVYQYTDKDDLGIELVLVQRFSTEDHNEWHLNQDLVFALRIKREGDVWLKPDEDYCEAARLRRDGSGSIIALEIKNEFLRDYLCARDLLLRISSYRKRAAVVADIAEAGSPKPSSEKSVDEQLEVRVESVLEGGHLGGGSFAAMRVFRTDVDPEEDVPLPGPETDANTGFEQWQGQHKGRELILVSGELWRDEYVEPGTQSVRVREDEIPTGIQYIVDASGATKSSESLNDEDIMRWLWFRPEVIPAITKRRSGSFLWYTMDTGGVGFSGASLTHFGINSVGLVTVYAADIAKLPAWQQRVWVGYNVVPEGKVSVELLSAQTRAVVAETTAPEQILPEVLKALDERFASAIGSPLFRPHAESSTILSRIGRFRALEPGGLFALAKDLTRLISDQIDVAALRSVAPPPKGKDWKSIKSLEGYLSTLVPHQEAHSMVGPLAGAYELRLADAHMPKGELNDAYTLVRVDPNAPPLTQGFCLVASVVSSLMQIDRRMAELVEKK